MIPSATRVTVRLVVCLSGTAVTIISLPVLVKNELGNPYFSLLLYCILFYTGSSSVNWLTVSCILTATLWDTGFSVSQAQFMCLIINHFVMYYSNLQVNYMVTVVIRSLLLFILYICFHVLNVLFACVFSNTDTVSWLVGVQIKVML